MVVCFAVLLLSDAPLPTPVENDANRFEEAVVAHIDAIGSDREETTGDTMRNLRTRLIAYGPAAIVPAKRLLTHRQVNVRRGAAIVLFQVVEKHAVVDAKLLNDVLLRMVEEEDIKCRSNLYHVADTLVENLVTAPQ